MERNNFIISRAIKSTPSTNYRSVKYKVALSDSQRIDRITSNTSQIQHKPYQTQKQNWRKRSNHTYRRQSKSSFVQKEMPQESPVKDIKISYLSTWDKLLASSQKSQLLETQQQKIQTMRVHLPCIIDFEPSKFTSLDPLFLPFEDIQRGIDELKAAIPPPKKQMDQIHNDMQSFKVKMLTELDSIQKHGMRQIKMFRNMLRADSVSFMEEQLKLKRQCLSLENQDRAYKSNFEQTKPRLDCLQDQLFGCRPFSLGRNQYLDQQFPQQYF